VGGVMETREPRRRGRTATVIRHLPVAAACLLLLAGLLAGCLAPGARQAESRGAQRCLSGRMCWPGAGLSIALAPGWSPKPGIWTYEFERGDAYDSSGKWYGPDLYLKDGTEVLGLTPGGLDELQRAVVEKRTSCTGCCMCSHEGVSASRVQVPVGEAVRVTYASPWFNRWTLTVEHWFFTNGRLWELSYGWADYTSGGAPPLADLATDPDDLKLMLESLRAD